jgi:hypothetical protein
MRQMLAVSHVRYLRGMAKDVEECTWRTGEGYSIRCNLTALVRVSYALCAILLRRPFDDGSDYTNRCCGGG